MATSTALTKPSLKVALAEALYNEILSNSNNYYYFLGRTLEWTGNDEASVADPSFVYDVQTRTEMIFLKKITSADVAFVVPRYNWEVDKVFDMYDDSLGTIISVTCTGNNNVFYIDGSFDPSIIGVGYLVAGTGIAAGTKVVYVTETQVTLDTRTSSNVSGTVTFTNVGATGASSPNTARFYCITADNNVYKCLDNNGGIPSTSKPYSASHLPLTLDDGYIWKYLYTVPSSLANKFMSATDMPVTTAIKNQYYSRGSLTAATVQSYGKNYEVGDYLVVTGDGHLKDNIYRIFSVALEDGGYGYATTPTLTIADPYESTSFLPSTNYIAGIYVKAGSRIYRVESAGTSSTVTPTHTSGNVVYNGTTAFRFVGLSVSATATIDASGSITTVNTTGIIGYVSITSVGRGYDPENPPAVTITGTGSGAELVADVSVEGYLLGIKIISRGSGYTNATITIAPPPGTLWTSGGTVGYGQRVYFNNRLYTVTSAGLTQTLGTTGPIHTSGSATNGAVTLQFFSDRILATAVAEIYYGFGYLDIPSVTAPAPFVADVSWSANGLADYNDIVSYDRSFYRVTSAGTNQMFGISPPLHNTGTVTNGLASLLFIGRTAILSLLVEKTAAKMSPVIENGQIVSVIVNDPGYGYTTALITAYGAGEGAVIEPNLSVGDVNTRQANIELLAIPGAINAIKIIRPGSGYVWANVTVDGDGTGCTATAVITSGVITKIAVTNPGYNYTRATVTITGNVGSVQGYAHPIIAPIGGHGKNAIKELFAKDISMSTTVARDRNQGFVINNDYRQIGIIKNPTEYQTNLRYTNTLGSTCFVLAGGFNYLDIVNDMIITDDQGFQYRVVAKPDISPGVGDPVSLLVQSLGITVPVVGQQVFYGVSGSTTVSNVVLPTINKYSGDLLFIDNRNAFQPTDDQTVSLKTAIRF